MYKESLSVVPGDVDPRDPNRLRLRAEALALSGDRPGGLEILKKLEHDRENSSASFGVISPADLGISYAVIGEKERALAWLQKAYRQHDPPLAQVKVEPGLDVLRSDPRYIDLLTKVGLNN
jgi:hypothetical protein